MSAVQVRDADSAGHILVELHNYSHMSATYGESYACAALQALQLSAHVAGGRWPGTTASIAVLPDADAGVAFAGARVPGSAAERWQLQFCARPFLHEGQTALPVAKIDAVQISAAECADGGLYEPQELERQCGAAPFLSTVQCGLKWRIGCEADIVQALAFHDALAKGQVSLAYQPAVRRDRSANAADRRPLGQLYQEALLRFDVPPLAPASLVPASLVPALERLGLVRLLDRVVLDAVIDRLDVEPTLRLGCNLSSLSLIGDAWWSGPLEHLQTNPALAAWLTLEITETVALTDFDSAVQFVRRLQALGCQQDVLVALVGGATCLQGDAVECPFMLRPSVRVVLLSVCPVRP